jgi:hypothetical protein
MSEGKRSFFATIPGLVTGLAGLLTGIVGLVTVLIQLGVLGGDNASDSTSGGSTTTTVAQAGGGGPSTTEVPRFVVNPTVLDFPSGGPRTRTVTVTNESSVPLNVQSPQITGPDRAQFSVSPGNCTSPVGSGRTCELSVTFSPSGPLRNYQASLEVGALGARTQEVRLTASSVLG